MRTDDIRLLDVLIAASKLQRFLAGMTFEEFLVNDMAQSAMAHELQVIGEAARRITNETREAHAEIEWHTIAGLRNRLVHEYFAIKPDIVWEIVRDDIPPLIVQLRQIIPTGLGTEK